MCAQDYCACSARCIFCMRIEFVSTENYIWSDELSPIYHHPPCHTFLGLGLNYTGGLLSSNFE